MSISPKTSKWTIARALLTLGLISSLWAWWVIAPGVMGFTSAGMERHSGHFNVVYLHALGGTVMLFLGLANLYIGTTRRFFQHHRLVGRLYLLGGGLGAFSAIYITTGMAHKAAGISTLTNSNISLIALASAWLLAAGMAFRAVRNRRYDSHREWMIRSYVLTWTFVGCRLATMIDFYPWLGAEGVTAAIWINWIVPLVVCEIVLRWREGERISHPSA